MSHRGIRIFRCLFLKGGPILIGWVLMLPEFSGPTDAVHPQRPLMACARLADTATFPALRTWYVMGTVLTVWIPQVPPQRAREVSERIYRRIRDLDREMSLYRADSALWRLNRSAGQGPVRVSRDLWNVIARAIQISRDTRGDFDITVGPYMMLWGFFGGIPRRPTSEEIRSVRRRVGYPKIRLNRIHRTVELLEPGMVLDLGGIAKGYAVDEAVRILRDAGIRRALVHLGGEIYVLGPGPTPDCPWVIGIRHPRRPHDVWRYILLVNMAVSTSGDTERYLVIRGKRYPHILSPHTGQPVRHAVRSVTVVAPTATWADGLASALWVAGPRRGRAHLRRIHAPCAFVLWIVERMGQLHEVAAFIRHMPADQRCASVRVIQRTLSDTGRNVHR